MNKKVEWWKQPEFASFFAPTKTAPNGSSQNGSSQGIGGGGKYGFTGNGPDGISQPDRRVPGIGNGKYDAHESEFVFNANATQAIGPDILGAMQQQAQSGKLDVNKLRAAIGEQPKPGFKTGTPGIGGIGGAFDNIINPITGVPQTISVAPIQGQTLQIDNQSIATPLRGPELQNIDNQSIQLNPVNRVNPRTGVDTGIGADRGFNATTRDDPDAATRLRDARPVVTNPVNRVNPRTGVTAGFTTGDRGVTPGTPTRDTPFDNRGLTVDPSRVPNTTPDTISDNTRRQLVDLGVQEQDIMDYIRGIMDGSNPYFKIIKDALAQDISGAGAAATAAMKQEGAQQNLSEGQVSSLGIGRQRDIEANTSKALTNLSVEQQRMGIDAANNLWDKTQVLKKYGDDEIGRIAADIDNGMIWGSPLQKSKYPNLTESEFNSMATERRQRLELQDQLLRKYGDEEVGRIADDIAKGMLWGSPLQKNKYPNLTEEEFNSFKNAGPLGSQTYDRKVTAFNVAIEIGNYDEAGRLAKELWPDSNMDFSDQKVTAGMAKMSKYIASNMSWEDAADLLDKDGTLKNLGFTGKDDPKAKAFYENLQVRNSGVYQLMNAIPDNVLKSLFPDMTIDEAKTAIAKLSLFGGMKMNDDGTFTIDYDVFDKIFGGGGTGGGGGTYDDYYKSAVDAGVDPTNIMTKEKWESGGKPAKYVPENITHNDGDTWEDGGKTYVQVDGEKKEWSKMNTKQQSEFFLSSVPLDKQGEWNTDRWEREGKPKTFDEWKESIPTNKIVKDYIDNIQRNGWENDQAGSDKKVRDARDKFMTGEVLQSTFAEMKENWTLDDINKKAKIGTVMMFDEYPNPVVVTSQVYDVSTNYIQFYVTDLNTGEGHNLIFLSDPNDPGNWNTVKIV